AHRFVGQAGRERTRQEVRRRAEEPGAARPYRWPVRPQGAGRAGDPGRRHLEEAGTAPRRQTGESEEGRPTGEQTQGMIAARVSYGVRALPLHTYTCPRVPP